jgi:hypothetical protein
MASIKNLAMAPAVVANERVATKSGFLGLTKSYIYTPTNSPLSGMSEEFDPKQGERLIKLMEMPLDKMEEEVKVNKKPMPTAVGHVRMEACISEDQQFVAVQVFRFLDFGYQKVFDVKFFEGDDAARIVKIIK